VHLEQFEQLRGVQIEFVNKARGERRRGLLLTPNSTLK